MQTQYENADIKALDSSVQGHNLQEDHLELRVAEGVAESPGPPSEPPDVSVLSEAMPPEVFQQDGYEVDVPDEEAVRVLPDLWEAELEGLATPADAPLLDAVDLGSDDDDDTELPGPREGRRSL